MKDVGQAFKETDFPSGNDRQAAWESYQAVVQTIKEQGDAARAEQERRTENSAAHLAKIDSYISELTADSGLEALMLTIITGGVYPIAKMVLEDLHDMFFKSDRAKEALQERSQLRNSARAYFNQWKGEMTGKDKAEALRALNSASVRLDGQWASWKAERDSLHQGREQERERRRIEKEANHRDYLERQRVREEKHEAYLERQRKHAAWAENQREFIARMEERESHLESVLSRKEAHLSDLRYKRDEAWSDGYRDRVDGWIDEEVDAISSVAEKLRDVRQKLSEARDRLRS